MYELYQIPANSRFRQYLKLLQGNSRYDMELLIGGYNPMAKDHILQKIEELKKGDAEQIMSNACKTKRQAKKRAYRTSI